MNVNINNTTPVGTAEAQRQAQALKVAQQFEEIFVGLMVQSLRKSQLGNDGGMFGSSVGSNTYEQWFDKHMSEHITKTTSIGIRDTLIREFRRNGELPPAGKEINHVA
jgi:Rod binding domain-containing protein